MTDLKPEDRALIERVRPEKAYDPKTSDKVGRFFQIEEPHLKAIIDAARAEGPRTDCYECGTYDVIGPICAQCNPKLAAIVRGEGLRSPSGGGEREPTWRRIGEATVERQDLERWKSEGRPTLRTLRRSIGTRADRWAPPPRNPHPSPRQRGRDRA